MLQNLINGKEKSCILLLEDDCQTPGQHVLKSIICGLSSRVPLIHLILLEFPSKTFLEGLPQYVCDRLQIHDVASDPLGWSKCGEAVTMDTDFLDYITKLIGNQDKVAVVIDCVSNLIHHRSAAYTCQVLHRAGRQISDGLLVAGIHKELHDNAVLRMLHHVATSILELQPSRNQNSHGVCRTIHKKTSGKVLRHTEQYKVGHQFELLDIEEVRENVEVTGPTEDQPDPAANLTFNLSLSDKEKEARAGLVLPYLPKENNPGKHKGSLGSGSAKIFYQPDDADDFDEEDPDDDLNI